MSKGNFIGFGVGLLFGAFFVFLFLLYDLTDNLFDWLYKPNENQYVTEVESCVEC